LPKEEDKPREQISHRKAGHYKSKHCDVCMERKNGTVYEKVGFRIFFVIFFCTEKFYWESIMYGNSSFRDDFCLLCFIYVQYSLAEFCVGGLFFLFFPFLT